LAACASLPAITIAAASAASAHDFRIAISLTVLAQIAQTRPQTATNRAVCHRRQAIESGVNKSGLTKVSETEGNPARWRARYASVSFVMFGRADDRHE
jgi:hypothetical protein